MDVMNHYNFHGLRVQTLHTHSFGTTFQLVSMTYLIQCKVRQKRATEEAKKEKILNYCNRLQDR